MKLSDAVKTIFKNSADRRWFLFNNVLQISIPTDAIFDENWQIASQDEDPERVEALKKIQRMMAKRGKKR
jgi:hypothetical protein